MFIAFTGLLKEKGVLQFFEKETDSKTNFTDPFDLELRV